MKETGPQTEGLGNLVDQINDLVQSVDPDGRLEYVNRTWLESLGYDRDEVEGMTMFDVVHRDDHDRFRNIFAGLKAGKKKDRFHLDFVRKDGSRLPVEGNVLIQFENGNFRSSRGVFRDMTEERNIRKDMDNFFDLTVDLICIANTDGYFVRINPTFEKILGYEEEEILATPFIDFVHEDDVEATLREIDRLAQGEPTIHFENRYRCADNSYKWLSWSAQPDVSTGNLYAVAREITELKQVEHALRRSEARHRALVAAIPDMLFRVDEDGIIRDYVAPKGDPLAPDRDKILLKTIYDVLPEAVADQSMAAIRRVLNDGGIDVFEYEVDQRGEHRYYEARSSPAGEREILCIIRNITRQKIASRQLEASRDLALEVSRLKSDFLANMSHEIRTPLNAVIGMTSLLLDTRLDAEQEDFVSTIRSSGDALLAVINNILDFSKIEAGKVELEEQPFELQTCIEEALDLVAATAAEKGVNLAYMISEQIPTTLIGDSGRVRQVILNLLSNAVKFTETGEVIVDVSREQVAGAEVTRVSIKDTGGGIPEERLGDLFSKFTQVDASTTRLHGGTGLGLAICKELIELMGGRIWVESQLGHGSEFCFTLPLVPAPTQRQFVPASSAALDGLRIMIVDDNETNRRILDGYVRKWGMVPSAFETPAAALKAVDDGAQFDLAILDMQMPLMSGLQLGPQLKQVLPELPIIMLSSIGQVPTDSEGLFAGSLTKPIKPAQLHEALGEVMGTRGGRRGAADAAIDHDLAARIPLRILVVEDNLVNQKVACRILDRMGYHPDVAANGIEGLEAVDRQEYDLVFMDIQMPEMDGFNATRRIRLSRQAHQPWIVAMTAHASTEDRTQCFEAGMDDYISKPVGIVELAAAISRTKASVDEFVDLEEYQHFRRALGDSAEEVISEIMEAFDVEVASSLRVLAAGMEQQDAELINREAHKLQSTTGNLWAVQISRLCAALEQQTKDGVLDEGSVVLVAQLQRQLPRLKVALRELTGVHPPSTS